MEKLELAEKIVYDISDIGLSKAVDDIREINNRWFKGETIQLKDRFRYYMARGHILSVIYGDFGDKKIELRLNSVSRNCTDMAKYSLSLEHERS